MPRKKNTCTIAELYQKRYETIKWRDERFRRLMGEPETSGCWIIWGKSFNGKSSFAIKLMGELADCGMKVLYMSLEEGLTMSLTKKLSFLAGHKNIRLMDRGSREDLERELKKQRSANCVIVDSLQYLDMNKAGYNKLKEKFPNKLFIWISHATDKNQPKGLGDYVRYDASVKIIVDGFVASANSRYGGGERFVVWEEKARQMMRV